MIEAKNSSPKYMRVYSELRRDIDSGRWKPGERLPSEAELVRTFGVSRITIGRAVKDLQRDGLVSRRAGSGTFVTAKGTTQGYSFGVLIPELGEKDIFDPICHGMMASSLAKRHALVRGSFAESEGTKVDRALALCDEYIARGVSGVFFAPLEMTPGKDEVNKRIAKALDDADIPVVLLDRTVGPYPSRGRHDLVCIDNRRVGYVVTEHLLRLGARRLAFAAPHNAAASVDAREAGYREALFNWSLPINRKMQRRIDGTKKEEVRRWITQCKPDGIVCANDRTAAKLMHSLIDLGINVPDDIRLVGIDDLDFAQLLPVPLTTYRQPTRAIGAAAFTAMLDRLESRDLPTRDILLRGTLKVRRSCGSTAD